MPRRTSFRAGLVLLGVLSVLDLFLPLLSDGEHPPLAVALAASVIGLASLVLIVAAWRGARAVALLVALRLLSAVAAVPAFVAPGAPPEALMSAGLLIALTLVGVGLVVAGALQPNRAGSS
jgi:hypothetical protein